MIHTRRHAEGSAVGYCKARKGARSYYPLFCTVAQTGQVFDLLHRPGNVHDSRDAQGFLAECLARARALCPAAQLEVRLDSAFFSEATLTTLETAKVEYSISVPFERFVELKGVIEARRRWRRIDADLAYFELEWKPQSWARPARFVCVRTRVARRQAGPLQLDLFIPHDRGYEFKVIVTNKAVSAATVLAFHNGRGAQEAIFAQLKTQCQIDYVPCRRLVGNQIFLLAGVMAHNLGRELQMATRPAERVTTPTRMALWSFQELQTLRRTLFARAGRLTRPQGELTLTSVRGGDGLQRLPGRSERGGGHRRHRFRGDLSGEVLSAHRGGLFSAPARTTVGARLAAASSRRRICHIKRRPARWRCSAWHSRRCGGNSVRVIAADGHSAPPAANGSHSLTSGEAVDFYSYYILAAMGLRI